MVVICHFAPNFRSDNQRSLSGESITRLKGINFLVVRREFSSFVRLLSFFSFFFLGIVQFLFSFKGTELFPKDGYFLQKGLLSYNLRKSDYSPRSVLFGCINVDKV